MSLGDVARQLRAQKNAAGQSPAVVETFAEAARATRAPVCHGALAQDDIPGWVKV